MGDRGNPYITVVAVWIVSSLGVALVASSSISSMVVLCAMLFLILAAGYLLYKAYHGNLRTRDLGKDLVSDLRSLPMRILEDFGIVFGRVSGWWLQREARVREEMAEEQEREARKREKLAQWKQKRRTNPSGANPIAGGREEVRRGSQEERTEG